MATFKYIGEDDREFPAISVRVASGETFEAPKDFSAYNVVSGSAENTKASAPAAEQVVEAPVETPSVTTDTTAGA